MEAKKEVKKKNELENENKMMSKIIHVENINLTKYNKVDLKKKDHAKEA